MVNPAATVLNTFLKKMLRNLRRFPVKSLRLSRKVGPLGPNRDEPPGIPFSPVFPGKYGGRARFPQRFAVSTCPAHGGSLVAEHASAFLAADRLAEVVGVDFDGDPLVAGLDALHFHAIDRVGLGRELGQRFEEDAGALDRVT
jgi:hypothetical protein